MVGVGWCLVIVDGGDCVCHSMLVRAVRRGGVGVCADLDSGVRDGESCSDGTVHSSEFENGEKEGAVAFRIIGDGVGSGAGSAHSSGEGVVGGGVVVEVEVTGDWGWGRCRCLLSSKRFI